MDKSEVNPIMACRGFPAFPVVLVAVSDGKGNSNVVTIALVHMFSFNPPVMGIGVSPARYTYELLEAAEDFSINVPSKDLVEEVLYCGQRSGREVNKFEECGLEPRQGKRIRSPVIEECPVNLECVKRQRVDAGDHVWYLGEVVHAEMAKGVDRERALMYWAGEFRVVGDVIRRR
ncbi:MAG TPA: flavin reductase family protein [Methanomassiliicoccales archaeon]|mgnify:CR=1 FL=1|jgi:flavin reductase (DIM6/NTAB) family NADH-FMN oxidoreductase RutF|nr:flavin reductase family protein [Methanomassiliicoccales archaeon]